MVRIFAQVTTFIIISGLKIINTKKITVIGVSTYAKHSQYVSTATNFCAGIILSRGVWLNIPRTMYHLYTCAILRPAITVKWSSESHMSWLFGFIKGPKSALSISWIIIKPFQRFSWSFICDACRLGWGLPETICDPLQWKLPKLPILTQAACFYIKYTLVSPKAVFNGLHRLWSWFVIAITQNKHRYNF